MNSRVWRISGLLLLCAASWAASVSVRRAILAQQTRSLEGRETPFLMESALQFRMTRMVMEEGRLPERDPDIQVPEGVDMRETYSVGAEQVYTALARRFPDDWSLARRVRWISTGVFSLAVPCVACLIFLRTGASGGSLLGAAAGAALLAVSPAFAVRSSGLELSRENLAIPLFCFFLLAEALARGSGSRRIRWGWTLGAALSLAAAQCVWDLTQYATGLWVVWSWWRRVRTPVVESAAERGLVLAVTATQVATALLNPYLRAHAFLFSPVVALLLARCCSLIPWSGFRKRSTLALSCLGIALVWLALGALFVENYSHFGELLVAKLRHLNQKPADPSLLSYEQRIMWTPALNSSTWALTKAYFPASLLVTGIAMALLIRGLGKGGGSFKPEWFYALFTLPVYVFFFRFHVFLILFMAVVLGDAVAEFLRRGSRQTRVPAAQGLLTLFIGVELYRLLFFEPASARNLRVEQQQLLRMFEQMGGESRRPAMNCWGMSGTSYSEIESLVEILGALDDPGPVLANFGVSGNILADAGWPILLHPKFETPGIRDRVRAFYEHLFLKSEKELRDWAVAHGARYYVHSNGALAGGDLRDASRYMVDALEPPPEAAARVLENRPLEATWFRPVHSTHMYRVYRIVTPEDVEWAERLTRLAAMSYVEGDRETAKRRALQALSYHWKYEPAKQVLRDVPGGAPVPGP